MKKWIKGLLLLLILQFALVGCGSEEGKGNEQVEEGAGKTKKVLVKKEVFLNDELKLIYKYEYNKYGDLKREIEKDVNDNLISTKDYSYDKKKRLIEEKAVNHETKRNIVMEYEYDGSDNQTIERKKVISKAGTIQYLTERDFDDNSNLTSEQKFTLKYIDKKWKIVDSSFESRKYNEKGLIVESIKKDSDRKATFYYDEKGRRKKIITEKLDTKTLSYTEYEYDDEKREKLEKSKDSDGSISSILRTVYDKYNNEILFEKILDTNGKKEAIYIYNYTYDDNGTLVKREVLDGDNELNTYTEYDLDGLVIRKRYGFSGATVTFYYDKIKL